MTFDLLLILFAAQNGSVIFLIQILFAQQKYNKLKQIRQIQQRPC